MAEEYVNKMAKAIEATEREFSKIRAGLATPAILNNVRVDYYGTLTPIPQIAKVTVPEPRMLLVTPWEKTLIEAINKAILAANNSRRSRASTPRKARSLSATSAAMRTNFSRNRRAISPKTK